MKPREIIFPLHERDQYSDDSEDHFCFTFSPISPRAALISATSCFDRCGGRAARPTTCRGALLRQHIPPVLMRLGLFPEDAGHRIVVGPTEPRKFGANVSVHLLLAQNEETIVGVVRDECQDVVEGYLLLPLSRSAKGL